MKKLLHLVTSSPPAHGLFSKPQTFAAAFSPPMAAAAFKPRYAVIAILIVLGFVVSVYMAMESRSEARALSAQLQQLRDDNQRLEDEHRSLVLEYHTFSDYATLRERAAAMGMVEPSYADNNLMYLTEADYEEATFAPAAVEADR